MNIYDFFNSKTIAEHCRKIGYKFTALEMAYIIWFSEYRTLKEKHGAWQYLIDNMPDERLPKCQWCDEDGLPIRKERSLHNFLKHYIQIERDFIEDFKQTREGYIYDYGTMNIHYDEYSEDNIFYSSYELCIKEMTADFDEDTVAAKVTRRKLYSKPHGDDWDRDIIYLNKDQEVMRIESYSLDEDWAIKDGFSSMYFHIPTPFQLGDLVACNSVHGEKQAPFVLAYVPGWEKNERGHDMTWYLKCLEKSGGDWTDMQTSIYTVSDDGDIYWDHGPNYMFLEYCAEKLKGEEKVLRPLSNFMKNQISLEDFLTAYDVIRLEKRTKSLRVHFGDIDEVMYRCGLLEDYKNESKGED